MSDNPFQPPRSTSGNALEQEQTLSSGQATYNVVTDTVTGVNVRWSDNKFQAIFVAASILIAATIGAIVVALNGQWKLPWYAGAIAGSFAGMLFGIFASGVVLMIYRAMRHIQGKHD
ncbi:MAG: hypothetical protein KGQ51_05770 [Planctomycetes bacterium]|nr:hypothetical protein [Planctomycetota bacterium]